MIRIDDIRPNPFGVQSTPGTLLTDLDKIGTLEQWTTKYGQMFDHDMRLIERVSRLLTEGVKDWIHIPPPSMGATSATWWILMNAQVVQLCAVPSLCLDRSDNSCLGEGLPTRRPQ